jgi:hypothetical protein
MSGFMVADSDRSMRSSPTAAAAFNASATPETRTPCYVGNGKTEPPPQTLGRVHQRLAGR